MSNEDKPRDRLEKCLSGNKTDRPPVALWRHFPVDDQTPDGLAAAVATFQKVFDFDFIKVTPASSFAVKDWGSRDVWKGNPEGTRDFIHYGVNQPEDWLKLKPRNPLAGYLGAQIHCLNLLIREFSSQVPIIQTIFSPLSQAKNLVGKENLMFHLRSHPEAVHKGLHTITQTTIDFIRESAKTGIDGIFYAVQHAQYGLMPVLEFQEFGRQYDLQVLDAAKDLWLNVGHIHGERIMFDQVSDYPVQILNWHDRHTPPSLGDSQKQINGTVCGGLRQWETMVLGEPADVRREARDAIEQTQGTRFILGTGCVVPITAPGGNISAARQAVNRV